MEVYSAIFSSISRTVQTCRPDVIGQTVLDGWRSLQCAMNAAVVIVQEE